MKKRRAEKKGETNGFTKEVVMLEETEATKACSDHTAHLHNFECLPDYLRFNQFIHTGYRLNLSTCDCLKSLFYFHNETMNIYTHGVACLVFMFLGPYIYQQTRSIKQYPVLYTVHYIASILCVLCSALYHLLMCHRNGATTYDVFIKTDMIGIWFVTSFGPITFIYCTFLCTPLLYNIIFSVHSIIAVIGLIGIIRGKNVQERLRPLIYLGVLRLPIYTSRGYMVYQGYISGELGVIWLLLLMETCGLCGALINLSRLPERVLCGKVDYICNSHNIMHIIVLFCPLLLHLATVADFQWLETAKCSNL